MLKYLGGGVRERMEVQGTIVMLNYLWVFFQRADEGGAKHDS